MNYGYNMLQVMGGWLSLKAEKAAAGVEDIILPAIATHMEYHSNDGLALFIWATPSASGLDPWIYYYPMSAEDAEKALDVAKGLHRMRGIPPSGVWELLFQFGA
jgi:hypothetical protein